MKVGNFKFNGCQENREIFSQKYGRVLLTTPRLTTSEQTQLLKGGYCRFVCRYVKAFMYLGFSEVEMAEYAMKWGKGYSISSIRRYADAILSLQNSHPTLKRGDVIEF